MKRSSLAVAVAVAVAVALTLVACKPSKRPPSSQTTTNSGTVAPSASSRDALTALEAKMVKGKAVGSNASEKKIARAMTDIFADEDGAKDWAAIVRVDESASPKKVVLLVRMDDLRGVKKGDRKEFLDLLAAEVDDAIGPGADLAIGIKGKVFFGAVGTRTGSGSLKKTTGSVVDTKPLEDAVAAL